MRGFVFAVAAFAVLATAAAAGGPIQRIVGVGADGRRGVIRLAPTGARSEAALGGPRVPSPPGGYVRVFPEIGDLPGIPGRFYPQAGVLCFDALGDAAASCSRLRPGGLRVLTPLSRLTRFSQPPTRATSVQFRHRQIDGEENVATAFELAFDRRQACCFKPPSYAIPLTVKWHGPASRRRPTGVRLGPKGVYANSHLNALGVGVWCYVQVNLPRWSRLPEAGEPPLPRC